MADIKLSYFDARGRAELSRLILAYAGVGLYLFLQISLFDILNETEAMMQSTRGRSVFLSGTLLRGLTEHRAFVELVDNQAE